MVQGLQDRGATSARRTVHARGWVMGSAFVLLMVAAALLRLHLATTEPYIHDEDNTAIPLSKTISFEPGRVNLPIRGENHGALPAYVVKASSTLFGATPIGYRAIHVAAGLGVVVLLFLMTREWFGPVAALWAAAFVAFNEYYLAISSRATAHVPHFFFVTAAVYAFSRFLRTERPLYVYLSGAALGLAFYCKEHSALLLPVFFITLLHAKYRRWLLRPHVYLACVMFLAIVSVDLYWNMTVDRQTARIPYGTQEAGYATYQSHLARVGGIGFSPYPLMFYARRQVRLAHLSLTGRELRDETPEYRSMNPGIGVVLLAGVLVTTFRRAGPHDVRRFLLIWFWTVFGLFTLIARGDPPGRLDPVSWIWVETTMLPAAILTGAALAGARGKWRAVAWLVSGAALLYSSFWTLSVE
jgi:4-amino-4-deoxy-L-arabinose transferase-like glycosyltransferase